MLCGGRYAADNPATAEGPYLTASRSSAPLRGQKVLRAVLLPPPGEERRSAEGASTGIERAL